MFEKTEVTLDELRHLVSERAIEGETMLLTWDRNIPARTALRLLLELDGELVINCIPDIGYLHTGVEKNMEASLTKKPR